ncbi:MAG: malate synthase A [Nakamurella sp.]
MTFPITTPEIRGTMQDRFDEILTPQALVFLAKLDGAFAGRRAELLTGRRARAARVDAGADLGFLPETAALRADSSWRVAPPGPGLERRLVEITGPASQKMTVNALNSGADVWMADLEDATAPTWNNIITGQLNLYDAIRGNADFIDERGKEYQVGAVTPTVMLRPRGWRLCEKHIAIDSRPMSASLVDFGLYFFHNAQQLIDSGTGPYFYLPKLESHLEARLWNDVFILAQDLLGIPRGTIRATVLIETLPAAMEMDEILYELREHSAGLNAGRWDYIFSYIRTYAQRGSGHVLSDRSAVTMTTPFLRSYTELLVATCHRRGAHAIGGMAAFVPDRSDPETTRRALAAVQADKDREAADGFDGSWVAHPGLVPVCREAFTSVLGDHPDQRDRLRAEVSVTAADLTEVHGNSAVVTVDGVRKNVSAALRYLSMWIGGSGAVAIDALMEDAATVEISRAQLWQWIKNRTTLAGGTTVTREMVTSMIAEEVDRLIASGVWGTPEQIRGAVEVLTEMALGDTLPTFFTPYAYVRYLAEKPLRMVGPLTAGDLRMSERVPNLLQTTTR